MAWTSSASPRGGFAKTTEGNHATHAVANTRLFGRSRTSSNVLILALLSLQTAFVAAAVLHHETLTSNNTLVGNVLVLAAIVLAIFTMLLARAHKPRPAPSASIPPETAANGTQDPAHDVALAAHPVGQLPADVEAHLHARAANDEAGRTAQAEAWSELLHQVHHELRTPLNAVLGFTDLMRKETFGPLGSPRYQEYLDHIQHSGERLLRSTEGTLAMTTALASGNATAATKSCVHLNDVAIAAWDSLPVDAQQLGFKLEVIGGHTRIRGDEDTLRQVFANLFSEAMTRSEASGDVLLCATQDADTVRIEVMATVPATDCTPDLPSLDLCIARTLLELHGGGLITIAAPGTKWRAVTVLDVATQADFFQDDTSTSSHADQHELRCAHA